MALAGFAGVANVLDGVDLFGREDPLGLACRRHDDSDGQGPPSPEALGRAWTQCINVLRHGPEPGRAGVDQFSGAGRR